MTFARVWTILRWPLAIIGLLAVVNYALPRLGEAAGEMIEFDASGSILAPETEDEPEEDEDALDIPDAELAPETLEPPTGPVTDGAATPVADFFVNDIVADVDQPVLVLSDDPADSAVIAFEIPPGAPACMALMNLNLTAVEVASATEVGVYASTIDDPVGVVDNQAIDGDLRATQTPMATALFETTGTVTLDITAGYQQYFTQGFAPGRPLVLTLAAVSPVETQGGVTMAASETADDSVPRLLWNGTPGCPVDPAAPVDE
ncbi:hypothetical protein [Euzebya tangerina]|uniref:hypothetical protein n=1 Tax=Euzebya tangerina TaxID=591198 RepID=UPI000E3230D2|nr:hypothetical protein [Euzebya tangerina]